MEDIVKRLNYYTGQFLREQDFTEEQEYHIDRLRRHNVQLHTPGIAAGLAVTATVGAISAVVAPGTAVDKEGRQIVLKDPFNVAFESAHNGQWVLVVISFREEEADAATVGDAGMTRMLERPDVGVVLEAGAPDWDMRIRLARLRIAANGTIAEHDTSIRTPVGARVRPDETFERLRLSRQGGNPNQFPVLSSGAANRADLAGDLSVTGNINVTGTVDGRDVSVDGVNNDNHRARIDNPHSVTAAQVGAIASIAGVSNPGGGITLNGANGISIVGNDPSNTITFTGGSPISIDGVSNPGGNIDFVGQNGISITPDDGGNLIAFSTSPGAIGALPIGDYLKRSVGYVLLNNGDGNGATRTLTCNFEPKFIWATATFNAVLGGNYHSFSSTGFCKVDNTSSWTHYCTKCFLTRSASIPYLTGYSYADTNGIASAYFYDSTQSPSGHNTFTLKVTQVTGTGFTVTLERTNSTGREVSVFTDFQFAIFG